MRTNGWLEWETNSKGGDKRTWLLRRMERKVGGRTPEAAGDHRRVLQGNLLRGKESSQEGRNNSLKPETAAENF